MIRRRILCPMIVALLITVLLPSFLIFFPIGNPPAVSAQSQDTGSITVLGESLNGSGVNGIFVDLRVNGNHVTSGFTNVTFSGLQLGVQYGVVVYWAGNDYIRYINDSNTGIDLQRYDLVTLTQAHPSDTLTGMFEYVPSSQAASLNIIAEFENGTKLGTASVVNGYDLHTPGMWLTVTPPFQSTPYTGTFTGGSILPFILFDNQSYRVQMSLGYFGPWVTTLSGTGPIVNITWSHWNDNNSTDANRRITLNGNESYNAIYTQSPITQATTASVTNSSHSDLTTATSESSGSSSHSTASTSSGPPQAPPPGGSSQRTDVLNVMMQFFHTNLIIALVVAIVIAVSFVTAFGIRRARR